MGFSQFQDEFTRRAADETRRSSRLGRAAEDAFFQRALNFNAQDFLEESTRGVSNRLIRGKGGVTEQLRDLRGESAGRFRSDTGFQLEDQDFILEDFNQRLADAIAANSLQAGSLQLQNQQQLGSFGQNVQNRFVNLLGGGLDRATAEQNAKGGSLFGKIVGGGLGLIAGSVVPGIGNAVGTALGERIGGAISK